MKTRRFSLGVKIASILSCLALTAVGFASWLIIKPTAPVERFGAFEVYTVEENDVVITVAPAEGSVPNIVWGKATTTNANPWLVAGADVQNQSLSATFTVTVTSTNSGESAAMNLDDILSAINVEFKFADATDYSAALAAGYVAAPTVKVSENNAKTWSASNSVTDSVAPTADVTTMTFDVVVTFAWGTNGNPYTYYNGLDGEDPENIAAAVACLEAIAELADDSYSIKISTTAKSE